MQSIRWRVLSVTVIALLAPWTAGADTVDRAENLEFDEETGGWIEIAAPQAGTAEGDLQIARALHSTGKHSGAKNATKRWIREYGEFHSLYPQAVLLQCSARIADRDYYKAHVRLQEFLNEFAGTEYEEEALEMEFVVAEVFLNGTKRKWLGMRFLTAQDIGLSILDDISANYPGTRIAELATLTKAEYYYMKADFAFAEQEYEFLVRNFPRSRYVRPAMLQGARSALASFPGIDFDDAPLIEAEELFGRYLSLYPASAEQEGVGLILTDIKETRAAKELTVGKYYLKTGHRGAAEFYFDSTISHWPETIAAIQAAEELELMGEIVRDEPSTTDDGRSHADRPEPDPRSYLVEEPVQ